MKSFFIRLQDYFLVDYRRFPLSIQIRTRYLLIACYLGLIMIMVSSISYALAQTWPPVIGNIFATFCVVGALFLLKKGHFIPASNLALFAILACLLLYGMNEYFFTGQPFSRISELGDTIVQFQFGLIFVGFVSYRRYQPIIFTLSGIVAVTITYYLSAQRHNIYFFEPQYIVKYIDALTFIGFSGIGSLLSFGLFTTLINHLETESYKVNNINKQLETTVKLRTIELEVTNVELKEKSAELEKFNQELQIAKSRAEDASIAKEQFLSTMSHEIRTPLNAVIGMTHLLKEEDPRPDQLENLDVLQVSAKHLLSLINDILDFSKIESGKIEFESVPFSLRELFDDLRKMFLYKANEAGLKLTLQIDKDMPEYLIGDSGRLSQIVANLLSNAIKFTEKGEVTLKVLSIKSEGDQVLIHISVQDSGIGIPKEKLKNIFESFTQASSETTRKYGGTGLGLSIIKKLVELQRGTINVTSEINKGSTFTVEIPYTVSSKNIVPSRQYSQNKSKLKGLHILLVEDNHFNQEVVSKILDNWGITTDTCETGEETIALILQNNYDIILMDINLPGKDGFEITQDIRNLPNKEKSLIPVIAQTAEITAQSVKKAKEAGMNDVVPKPIIPSNLFDKIDQIIDQTI